MDRFQRDLKEKHFLYTFELVPGRSIRTKEFQTILSFIEKAPEVSFFSAFSITDNAGGHPALSPVALGRYIKTLGLSAIIHITCKDKNRNQLESELLALDREALHNLLVLSGDYPFYGYNGQVKPVFDLDSVLLLRLISEMEAGIEIPKGAPGGGVRLPPIPFFKGCAVSPFKLNLYELWWQYLKLYRKLKAGAKFIIVQVGFSPFSLRQLKKILAEGFTKFFAERLEDQGLHRPEEDELFRKIPVIPSILFLHPGMLKAILRAKIPGILLGQKVWERLNKASKPEEEALEICAKLCAIYQHLGFKGVHLCGFPPNWSLLQKFLERAEFYMEKIKTIGIEEILSEFDHQIIYEHEGRLYQKSLADLENPWPLKKPSLAYLGNQLFHYLFFTKESPFYPFFKKLSQWIITKKRCLALVTRLEYFVKRWLFHCEECGDCTLWNFNYLCPQSQCAKYLLNGACGGSFNGYCEVYPYQKECLYVRVLKRGKVRQTIRNFLASTPEYLPPRDWSLYHTSSWVNFYLQKGHFKDEN